MELNEYEAVIDNNVFNNFDKTVNPYIDHNCNLIKTEVAHQPAPGNTYNEPTINVNGQKLKVVDNFIYLGSTLSRAVHIDDEVTARIAKAGGAFGRLRANVWERNGIKLDTKLKIYKAVVLPTLLHVRPGQYTSVMQALKPVTRRNATKTPSKPL